MRITSKGQVTIPQVVREQAGLHPGSEVEFVVENGKVFIRPAVASGRTWAREAIERTRGSGNNPVFKGWTTERIMQFLRGDD
ncbi:MAG: AbrB/MazE/SpoVT family DNA-binding domain-containing protein [Sterolibacteriaceae bacterium]|uniref:AbrB/MazE/SpoVT family DNA-binding domain-containing protein n=1 Tax=Candidatus Methylophosphatis roskildensis TaxID=2899263 RepID=A0A9D7DWK7_9PROT|nr:AbrB/MazE/SpoVT family DNA-binding domain-containing protein [Candidatus Methylophosphatis roskildensis]MBK7238470.1 AbrB/MazE/SpoVT family DNA-binding domain-containing protein [Sterolibacteriaceae bacterium]